MKIAAGTTSNTATGSTARQSPGFQLPAGELDDIPVIPQLPTLPDETEAFEVRTLTDRLVGGFLNPWLNYLLPAPLLRWIVGCSRSPILRETFRCPGGWSSTYLAYEQAPPVDWIDRIVLSDPIARSLRNRRQVVTRLLSDLITRYASQGPVSLLGIGAGPGAQFQDAILRTGLTTGQVAAWVVDLHDDAFGYGRMRAEELGLADVMHYTCGDARRIDEVLPDVRPQIVKLVGLIEYLDDDQVLDLLRAAHGVLTDDGTLLTNSFVDRYHGAPFLVRVLGLRHVYRTTEHVIDLLKQSGFDTPQQIETPMRMYGVLWTGKAG